MRKKWKAALCGLLTALVLTACGTTEDDIQRVEQEDIAAPNQEGEKGKESEETDAGEQEGQNGKSEETGVPKQAETQGESGDSETALNSPAVVTIETDRQEYKDGDRVLLITNYDDVTVVMEGNEAAEAAVMAEFAKRKEEFEERLELEETLDMARENPVVDGSISYSEENWFTLERNDGRVLSFSSMWDSYEGGAHGQYLKYGVNFDAGTGEVLTTADIARDKEAFREICVEEMKRQCGELKEQGLLYEDEMLTEDDLQGILEGKMEGTEWYFTENGIRFISNIYEIAPYAAGSIDFDIPYAMVNETLKEGYRG